MGGIERKAVDEGLSYYIPMRYSELPRFYRENVDPIKAAFFQVSPMDAHGYFTFGPSASHLAAMCKRCQYIFVEVNPKMPRCLGGVDNAIHISQISGIVENEADMWELGGGGEPTEVDKAVANLIVPQIPNGACLQLGIGAMPNAIGKMVAESDLRDLGVHTEMYVDAFVDMSMAGRITGACKPFDRGRQTYAFAAGSQKLYDFLNNNPQCMAAPVGYVNDIARVSQIDNFISINGAVDIDLFGQVSSESSGTRHILRRRRPAGLCHGRIPGQGRQELYLHVLHRHRQGRLRKKPHRPHPDPRLHRHRPRSCVQYIVTEHGMINLKGLSTWERAAGIISIAHPDFREELTKYAQENFF